MITWLRKNWRVVLSIVVGVVLLLLVWMGYLRWVKGYPWADWTGFGEYTGQVEKNNRGKTLWDWLQLLIIPFVLAMGAYFLNRSERINDRKIAEDRQREAALQAYFDKMTELLLDKEHPLRKSDPDDEVRVVARTRTLATLLKLDAGRKGMLIRFLIEGKLIYLDFPLNETSLEKADVDKVLLIHLSGADLKGAILNGAYLSGADLSGADLSGADLGRANLSKTNLSNAVLNRAILKGADLRKAEMSGTSCIRANMIGADLSGAGLNSADLGEATLIQAKLREADLNGADLIKANLSLADLKGADLSRANLIKVNLRKAVLRKATLIGANLRKANLNGAAMGGAILNGAEFTDAIMPNGEKYDPVVHVFEKD
jgi:uncharacterized protein YjbI with pentapeptide repeats